MSNMHASTSYGGHILTSSNPSSTHSSPQSFTHDLEPSTSYSSHPPHPQTYPIPGNDSWPHSIQHPQPQQRRSHPFFPHQNRPPFSNSLFPLPNTPSLQVTTNTHGSEPDPNEHTARPGNAHTHRQFHDSLSLPLPPMPDAGTGLVTPTAPTGSSTASSMSSAGLSTGPIVSSASSVASSFADAQQHHLSKARDQQQAALDSGADYITGTPGLSKGLSRPLTQLERDRLEYLDRLKYFLATAPSRWQNAEGEQANGGTNGGATAFAAMESSFASQGPQNATSHPQLNRFMLPSQEFVTCVYWNGLYHITGTDIVRALVFRFEAFGRPVRNIKKFEEGVFSDLRNLKPGEDACLEEPKSPFLDLLFKYQCIRTQKKQKVFYWFSVPHDRLFLDALDRDLKRERIGQETTTTVTGEPAQSFTFDPKRPLYEQFTKMMGAQEGESEFDRNVRNAVKESRRSSDSATDGEESGHDGADESDSVSEYEDFRPRSSSGVVENQIFGPITLVGSRTYKHRKRAGGGAKRTRQASEVPGEEGRGRGDEPGSSGARYGSQSASRERTRSSGVPPPHRYDSMMEEFGPGSVDERQQSEPNLSAAEFFLKQAKGQLLPADGIARNPRVHQPLGDVDVFYSEGAPPPPSSASSNSSIEGSAPMLRPSFQHSRTRSVDMLPASSHPHRHSYHGGLSGSFPDDIHYGPSAPSSSGFQQGPGSVAQTASMPGSSSQPRPKPPPPPPVSSTAMYEHISADGKVKVFPCPLFSCSRVFKRMEHLKRHLRTHTLERPFACNKCNKRFSRSDNLNQHLRTHERTGTGPSSDTPAEAGFSSGTSEHMEDDSDHEGGEYGNAGESDYSNPDMGYYSDTVGLSNLDLSNFADPGTYSSREYDPRDVQEVQGDEEGLLMISPGAFAQDSYYPQSSALFASASAGVLGDQWSTRGGTSSAFSPFGQASGAGLHMRGNRNSLGSMPANYMSSVHEHTGNPSISSLQRDELTPSLSAPSQRADFDHLTMYGSGMMVDDGSSAGGPIRRHRSMTPSLTRNGEPIRRPPTSNSGEFGLPGSTPSSVGSGSGASGHRGYHPYAGYSSSSRGGSAHSSPAIHNVPLGGGSEYHGMRSRGSSFVSANPIQMMANADVTMAAPDAGFSEAAMYRTDSPAFIPQSESPAPFTIDLPQYSGTPFYPNNSHSATMPAPFSSQQQQSYGEQYYPQHVTTL